MKTVLIAGGTGFLGSHLCELFLEKGYKVIAVDNNVTGSTKNIMYINDNEHFTYIEQDVTEPFEVQHPIDYVLHFASPASPIDYQEIPIKTLMAGSYATHNLLELAKKHNARFLMASTSEVYGDPLVHPQTEDYWGNVSSIGLRSCYDEAKRYAEACVMAYHRKYGIQTRIVRIFNTYGARMRADDKRVVPEFINQALNNQDITVFGDGSQTRSFCYVKDLIGGIYKLLLSEETLPTNIGNPTEYSMNDFANLIIRLTGSSSKIIYEPLPEHDPKRRKPDITKAKKVLNWEPKVFPEEGLKYTIEYFKEHKVTKSR
jgi:dTDP-glucose 4,6-dehydratase